MVAKDQEDRLKKIEEINGLLRNAKNLALNLSTIGLAVELLNIIQLRIAGYGLPFAQFSIDIESVNASIQNTIAGSSNMTSEEIKPQATYNIGMTALEKKISKINKKINELNKKLYHDKAEEEEIYNLLTLMQNATDTEKEVSKEKLDKVKAHLELRKTYDYQIRSTNLQVKKLVGELNETKENTPLPNYQEEFRESFTDYIQQEEKYEKIYYKYLQLTHDQPSKSIAFQDNPQNSGCFATRFKSSNSEESKDSKYSSKHITGSQDTEPANNRGRF